MNNIKRIIKYIVFFKFIDSIYNFLLFKRFKIKTPKRLSINGRVKVLNKGSIFLGENIRINSGKNYNTIGGDVRTNIIVAKNSVFSIGNNVGISNSTFFCSKKIQIEDDVLVGGGCKFYDTDFHALNYKERMNPYKRNMPDREVRSSAILVKNGAWIGGHSIILKGVTIGSNSIIGAGSVVSKSIPENEIWAGNPVKFIRKNLEYIS
ncbi:acyltransferase [Algibacter sp. Ld11]|uniref:acyltransferase n=1 Tax=Algibacter sp. Ld11 TaxID=649150 RepID=UPI0038708B16